MAAPNVVLPQLMRKVLVDAPETTILDVTARESITARRWPRRADSECRGERSDAVSARFPPARPSQSQPVSFLIGGFPPGWNSVLCPLGSVSHG